MSEPTILHWERAIHKKHKSEDGVDVGNIISESGYYFTIMQGASREYNLQKFHIEGFDGSETYLDQMQILETIK